MRTKTLIAIIMAGALWQLAPCVALAQQDVDSVAPVVVKTIPEAGSKDVKPGEFEIKVKFSKEMLDGCSWTTAWENSTPEGIGKPKYDADRKTCVYKVKLEPNKTYGYWLNSQRFGNFKDINGRSAVPYLLVFQTKGN